MPQPAKRTRIRRKDIRQPDEFATLTTQTASWMREHQGLIAGAVAAVAALGLVMLLVSRSRAGRAELASIDFRVAHDAFQGGKYPEAAAGFAALAEKLPGTPFGRLARLYRAHALARQGDAAAAATAYGEYLATDPDPAYLRQEALTGLARAKEAAGDTAGALEAYNEAATLDGPFLTDAALAAARLHEAAGRADEARTIYLRLVKEAPDPDVQAFLLTKVPAAVAEAAKAPSEDAGANVR
jgi:tetratricopeptide (TPR) repeat protein